MAKKFKRRILVTGGMGFIGSNYLNFAVQKYQNDLFVNIDLLTHASDVRNVTVHTKSNYAFEKANIVDKERMSKVFEKYSPTHVIHFAAETHVDRSIVDSSECVLTNVAGTDTLLQLSRDAKIKRFHLISTDEVYGALTLKQEPFSEKSPLQPRNPYSATKAASEFLALSYRTTFGLPVVITRSSNNYGPNQDRSKLIPKFINLLLEGKKVPLYASGSNIRDWVYVQDNVEAIDLVFNKGRDGEVYNIGGKEEFTNIDVTEMILAELGKTKRDIEFVADRPGHDFRYAMTNEKIEKELKWKPKIRFAEGLKKTITFCKKRAKLKHGKR